MIGTKTRCCIGIGAPAILFFWWAAPNPQTINATHKRCSNRIRLSNENEINSIYFIDKILKFVYLIHGIYDFMTIMKWRPSYSVGMAFTTIFIIN